MMSSEDYLQFMLIVKQHKFNLLENFNKYMIEKPELHMVSLGNEYIRLCFHLAKKEIEQHFSTPIDNIFDFDFVGNEDYISHGNHLAFFNKGTCLKEITRQKCLVSIILAIIGSCFITSLEIKYGNKYIDLTIREFQKNPTRYLACDCENIDDFNLIKSICNSGDDEIKVRIDEFVKVKRDFIGEFDLPYDFSFKNHYINTLDTYLSNCQDEHRVEYLSKIITYCDKHNNIDIISRGIGPLYWNYIKKNYPYLIDEINQRLTILLNND